MKPIGNNSLKISKCAFAVLLAISSLASLLSTPARAQDATLPTKEVNITLNQAPVRTALDTLFKSAGLNYTIDPAVTGLVTVSLRAIPFDVALRSILRSSDPPLAYTVEDGVYNIHPRQQVIDITSPDATTPAVAPAAASGTDVSTATQVVQLKLNYANAALILLRALTGGGAAGSGLIPALDAPPNSNRGGGGNTGGLGGSGGFGGGNSGGFGGGNSGGFGGGGNSGFGGGGNSGFGGGGNSGFGGGGGGLSTGF
jgi:hypothetical protein